MDRIQKILVVNEVNEMMEILSKIKIKLSDGVLGLKTNVKPKKGIVLVSYTTLPFTNSKSESGHTNRWECRKITEIFNRQGYDIDLIDFDNKNFIPKKNYNFCIDVGDNLERLSPFLPPTCVKILHITNTHWSFNNQAELHRIKELKKRRGFQVKPRRQIKPNKSIEIADIATVLGNEFTSDTYAFANKKITRIPISTTHIFPSPIQKDFSKVRKNFIWLGGTGMIHKGLDLVLEAFVQMPEYTVHIFGKKDDDVGEFFKKELFETPNIHYLGHVNLDEQIFKKTTQESVGIIFPSCSEGGSGGVITAMHAGLVPIVSYEAAVDVADFGVVLKQNTVDEIKKQVKNIANMSPEELQKRAVATWQYVRTHHTRERFGVEYESFVDHITTLKNDL